MKSEEVLGYIPKEELEKLSLTYNVDHQVEASWTNDVSIVTLFYAQYQT
jgi:hypothetical protein